MGVRAAGASFASGGGGSYDDTAVLAAIDALEDDVGDLAAADVALDGRLDTAEASITSHGTSLSTHTTDIAAAAARLTLIEAGKVTRSDLGALTAASQIVPTKNCHDFQCNGGGNITLTSVKCIADGTVDGQEFSLRNTGGSGALTIQDQPSGTDPDSNVNTPGATSVVIGPDDVAIFTWRATGSPALWLAQGFSNN